MSKRPPFENRWTSGRKAWRWHLELEAVGVENVRLRLALEDTAQAVGFPDAEIPVGFVRDWLDYHDRERDRRQSLWNITLLAVIGLVLLVAAIGAWPVLSP